MKSLVLVLVVLTWFVTPAIADRKEFRTATFDLWKDEMTDEKHCAVWGGMNYGLIFQILGTDDVAFTPMENVLISSEISAMLRVESDKPVPLRYQSREMRTTLYVPADKGRYVINALAAGKKIKVRWGRYPSGEETSELLSPDFKKAYNYAAPLCGWKPLQ